jgi:hypothetical protein
MGYGNGWELGVWVLLFYMGIHDDGWVVLLIETLGIGLIGWRDML